MGEGALGSLDFGSETLESEFDMNYGLLAPEQTVLVRAYSDDTDDRILYEVKPKFIVMVEPDMDFVRRIEVKNAVSLTSRIYAHS
jgi:DNA excision repair protein ERCC-4